MRGDFGKIFKFQHQAKNSKFAVSARNFVQSQKRQLSNLKNKFAIFRNPLSGKAFERK